MLSFDNTQIAFQAKNNKDLNRAYFLFSMVKHPWMVGIGKAVTETALKLRLPVEGMIKKTVFNHFCGGETIAECKRTIDELHEFGIGTILDYSVEGKASEKDFANCLDHTLASIDMAAKNRDSIPFSVFKPTGIGALAIWQRFSEQGEKTEAEHKEFEKVMQRFEQICQAAFDNDVPVLVDAEESWIQLAVDQACDQMMTKFNKERAIVFNTCQLYRHDRLAYLKASIEKAKAEGYIYGVKTVRGAYMEKERARAEAMSYPSPIQATKADSDKDYNQAILYCVANIDHVSLCAGTHNEQSAQVLFEELKTKGISLNDPRIFFAQLYGMSDHISFNLAKEGCNVAKYVPYGPVKDVMPYLFRRAEENTSVAGQTGRELSLLSKEKARRKNA